MTAENQPRDRSDWGAREILTLLAGIVLLSMYIGHVFAPGVTVADKTFRRLGYFVLTLQFGVKLLEARWGSVKAALIAIGKSLDQGGDNGRG